MEAASVLFVGRVQTNRTALAAALEKQYRLVIASSGKLAVELAHAHDSQVVILDADSMRTPGERICQALKDGLGHTPIIHIHPGPKRAAHSPADVVLIAPVSARKVTATIDRLLLPRSEDVISHGPLAINVDRRVLVVDGREIQLTPKQALLTELFMRHPGETLDRRTLMEKVWDTTYTGDTRTLDVHVRWIRQMIEADPGKPQLLQTVRGVGYRLVLSNGSSGDPHD